MRSGYRRSPRDRAGVPWSEFVARSYPRRRDRDRRSRSSICSLALEKGADRGAEAISSKSQEQLSLCFCLVGVAGFEPAPPSSRTSCSAPKALKKQECSAAKAMNAARTSAHFCSDICSKREYRAHRGRSQAMTTNENPGAAATASGVNLELQNDKYGKAERVSAT